MNEFVFALKLMAMSLVIVFALQFKIAGSTIEQKTYSALVKSGFAQDVQLGTQKLLNILGEKLGQAGDVIATKSEQLKRSQRSHTHRQIESEN